MKLFLFLYLYLFIGFKRIPPFAFNKRIDPGPTLAERVGHRRELQLHPERFEHENVDADWVAQRCDIVDHIIELHGHIIGMALSPDHRLVSMFVILGV